MTPVGDIELEIVFRIAVRGRTRDLAHLLETVNKAETVVMYVVRGPIAWEERSQEDVAITVRGSSR